MKFNSTKSVNVKYYKLVKTILYCTIWMQMIELERPGVEKDRGEVDVLIVVPLWEFLA